MRSVVQSIVLASLPSPNNQGRKPLDISIAAALGHPPTTNRDIVIAVRHTKWALLESNEDDKETFYSQVLKSKENPALQQKLSSSFVLILS